MCNKYVQPENFNVAAEGSTLTLEIHTMYNYVQFLLAFQLFFK